MLGGVRKIAVLFVLSLVVHGCGSIYSVVEFEVLDPATVDFPGDVEQILLLNRSPLTRNAFQKEDIEDMTAQQLAMIDTAIVNNLVKGVLRVLRNSPIKRFHEPIWYSERLKDTTGIHDMVLTRKEVEDLCSRFGVDAIIALEQYSLNLDMFREPESPQAYTITKYYEFATLVRWVIYLPGRPKPYDIYTLSDTLYFTEIQDGIVIMNHTSLSMIQEACERSGMKYGRYLVPAWNHTSRVIFRGKEDVLKEAGSRTDEGDWEEAHDIWNGLTGGTDSTLVAKAYHNLAVYYELEDRLDTAAFLLDRALSYKDLETISNYKEEMQTRIENRKDIMNQVR